MSTQTDTLARYAAAAQRLDADTLAAILDRADRVAPNDDDASDGAQRAIIALGESLDSDGALTLPVAGVVARCVQSATRDRLDRERSAPLSLDGAALDIPSPHAAARDGAARWEECRASLSPTDRAILDTLARDGLARIARTADREHAARQAQREALGESLADTARSAHSGAAWAAASAPGRLPLRVGVVASAVGAPAPRTRAASLALRASACTAWGRVSLMMGTARKGESLTDRAARALTYVQTDAASLGRQWADRHDLLTQRASLPAAATQRYGFMPALAPAPVTITRPAVYGPLCKGWERTDDGQRITFTQWAGAGLSASMPEARKGPVKRSRKGQVWASVSARYSGGVATGQAVGAATVAGDESETGAARAARTASRAVTAADTAALAHGLRWAAAARPCAQPLPDPYASRRWECAPVCGCGGALGQSLHTVLAAHPTDPTAAPVWVSGLHPLSACPLPLDSNGGGAAPDSDSARCGCGRKRGSLIRQGQHGGLTVWGHAPKTRARRTDSR